MGLQIVTIASFATLVVAYLWLIDAYAVNTIFVDQWSDLGLIHQAYSGHLTLSVLWAQHTDNRILFPNLVVLLLAKTTHFNVIDEEFISAFTLMAATALLIVGHRRRSPRTLWILYLPVAILMFSFVQNGDTLWGFQFAWYLVLLALSVALVLCDDPRWGWLVMAGAIVAAGPLDMARLSRRPFAQAPKAALRDFVDRSWSRDGRDLLCELQLAAWRLQRLRPSSPGPRFAVLLFHRR
jgi:hypothetical protein